MRTIEDVIAELRKDIHSDVYLGNKTINTYLDEILKIHKAESTQGDLISREALKKAMWDESHSIAIFTECGTEEAQFGLTVNEIEYTIDKAPTVERPQGEWLWLGFDDGDSHKWSCNKCGRGVKELENFCPNCGAENVSSCNTV